MYSVSKSSIKVNNEISDRFLLKIGVKQGDNLSPNLFKILLMTYRNIHSLPVMQYY
jgi:hypothetical protein